MLLCDVCGKAYMPVKEFEYIKNKLGKEISLEQVCPVCRRKQTVVRLERATATKGNNVNPVGSHLTYEIDNSV
jgi:rubredoxin